MEILDWKTDFVVCTHDGSFATDYVGIMSKTFSKRTDMETWFYRIDDADSPHESTNLSDDKFTLRNNPDEVGAIYTPEEFKSIVWYHRPYKSYSHS